MSEGSPDNKNAPILGGGVGFDAHLEGPSPHSETLIEEEQPTPDLGPPVIPGFRIDGMLGEGGMAQVWKAEQTSLGRLVAIKIMDPKLAERPHFVRRFEREARSLAALNHPNVVSIFDRGHANGRLYFAMEFVEGESLRDVLVREGGRLTLERTLPLLIQVVEALVYVHELGTIHRDLKPENVLLAAGNRIKLADFGLASMSNEGERVSQLTGTNVAMGTVHYMSPEQSMDARSVDHRSDIYSFGVLLYECLTGGFPVGTWKPVSELVFGVDSGIDRILAGCLASLPSERYERTSDLLEDLQALVAGSAPHHAPATAAASQGSSDLSPRNWNQKDQVLRSLDGLNLDPTLSAEPVSSRETFVGDSDLRPVRMGQATPRVGLEAPLPSTIPQPRPEPPPPPVKASPLAHLPPPPPAPAPLGPGWPTAGSPPPPTQGQAEPAIPKPPEPGPSQELPPSQVLAPIAPPNPRVLAAWGVGALALITFVVSLVAPSRGPITASVPTATRGTLPLPPEPATPTEAPPPAPAPTSPTPPTPPPTESTSGPLQAQDKEAVKAALTSDEPDRVKEALDLETFGEIRYKAAYLNWILENSRNPSVASMLVSHLSDRSEDPHSIQALACHVRRMGPEWREAQRVLEREGFELHPTAPASAATIARALTNNPRDPEVLGAIRALALMQGEEASEALAKMRRSAHPPFREAANQAWKQRWEQGLVDRR